MSSFTFGTPQQQQQPLFGAPLASSTPAFGGTQQAGTPSLFGNPASTSGPTGFSFSSTPSAAVQPQPQQTQFSLGGTQPQQTTGFSLGGTQPQQTSGFSLGGTQPQQSTGFSLGGTQPQQSTGFSLGGTQPQQSTGFSLGGSQPQQTGFSLGVTTQQPQTGFSLGGLGTGTATSTAGAGLGFSFGSSSTAAPASSTSAVTSQQSTTTTSSFGGLGGIPGSSGPRLSTLALGTDPGTGWSTRNDNRAVQELLVPPDILAAVEELKNQMKSHKTLMVELNKTFDLDIDVVTEQIEDVRSNLTALTNVMHKQELQCASLIKDMQELSKDMDLLSQAKDVPAFGYGGSGNLLQNFLFQLIDKYAARMQKYKQEIERVEFSLQTIVGAYHVNAKDLWASLTATKDTVILMAAQIQQLHEQLRTELTVHKNISQVLYATTPKSWVANAIAGNTEGGQSVPPPPLERVLNTPSKAASAAANLESMYQRTYSMLNRVPSLADPRAFMTPQSSQSPSFDPRTAANLSASLMSNYLASSSPTGATPTSSLKRSKK